MNNNKKINSGRKLGSRNKTSATAKKNIMDALMKEFKQTGKLFHYIPNSERFVALKPYAKMISTGDDETSKEIRKILFEVLKPEFKRMGNYISLLPAEKKAIELRQYLKMLSKEQIEEITNHWKKGRY